MSFCRWSSDDFQCDLYVYYSVGDFYQIHVAGRRHALKEPLPPKVTYRNKDGTPSLEYWDRHKKVQAMLDTAELVDIDLPCDGESYEIDTADECAAKMEELRDIGYNVPQFAIDAVKEDAD